MVQGEHYILHKYFLGVYVYEAAGVSQYCLSSARHSVSDETDARLFGDKFT